MTPLAPSCRAAHKEASASERSVGSIQFWRRKSGIGLRSRTTKPIPDFLRQNWMEPTDLSDADASLWAARQLGANGVIHGQIAQVKDSMIRLSLRIDGLGPTFYSDQEFTLNDPLTQLLKEDAPYIPLEPEPIPPEPGVFAPGQE